MTRYYKPTVEDFVLGLVYETKPAKSNEWEIKRITRDSYMGQDGALSEIHVIMHDMYTKDAKNHYRVPFMNEEALIAKGFTKSTPVFLNNIMYNTYNSGKLKITRKEHDFTIKDRDENTLFEGVILNETMFDIIMGALDLDTSANHKLRRKISTAIYE